jgi:heme/copper-type cytochrome/quinol oxidase subunit 2
MKFNPLAFWLIGAGLAMIVLVVLVMSSGCVTMARNALQTKTGPGPQVNISNTIAIPKTTIPVKVSQPVVIQRNRNYSCTGHLVIILGNLKYG